MTMVSWSLTLIREKIGDHPRKKKDWDGSIFYSLHPSIMFPGRDRSFLEIMSSPKLPEIRIRCCQFWQPSFSCCFNPIETDRNWMDWMCQCWQSIYMHWNNVIHNQGLYQCLLSGRRALPLCWGILVKALFALIRWFLRLLVLIIGEPFRSLTFVILVISPWPCKLWK